MYQQLLELIRRYDTICIYRHVNPDGDANGSQFGLKSLIEQLFPDKQVYALGVENKKTFFPQCYHGKIEYESALAIICDTANRARIDGEGYEKCDKIVKIDHHPIVDDYGDVKIVNEKACATCEIIGEMLMEHEVKLSLQTATYLYCGLLTDSQKFSIGSVSEKTFKIAAYLTSFDVDLPLINQKMFGSSLVEYRYETFLRSKAVFVNDKIGYITANISDYEQFNLTFEKAKEKVFVLGGIAELEVYCLFTQKADGLYAGSLRSKTITVNDIAAEFHGGGHKLASGVKDLSDKDIQALINKLMQRCNETQG